MVLLLCFFPDTHRSIVAITEMELATANSHPSIQSKTLKKGYTSFNPLLNFVSWKDIPFFCMFCVPAFPSFPLTDLICSKCLISVSSLLNFYSNGFPHRCSLLFRLTVLLLTLHIVLFFSLPERWVTIITPILQMGCGRKRHQASRHRGRYHSSCPPKVIFRHNSATSQHQPCYSSCKVPCMNHNPLTYLIR